MASRGPSAERGVTTERILGAARAQFAAHGYAGTTLKAIAAEADVDPRLVAYYFGNKGRLLEACMEPPTAYLQRLRLILAGSRRDRAALMLAIMQEYWEDPETAPILRALVLIAAHEPVALDRLMLIYRNNFLAAVGAEFEGAERDLRANLAASCVLGLSMMRYVYRVEPLASATSQDIVALYGPTLQRYLTGELPAPLAPDVALS